LQDLTARIQSVRNLLYDPAQTDFTLVAIPEAMSVRETQRYLTELREHKVPVTDLIVNRVEQEHDACVYCKARVKTQRPWLKEIEKVFGDLRLHYVPLQVEEVRGVDALRKFGKLVWTSDDKRS
jgi:arsenite/tail-anchored protein-transporting ATPase